MHTSPQADLEDSSPSPPPPAGAVGSCGQGREGSWKAVQPRTPKVLSAERLYQDRLACGAEAPW